MSDATFNLRIITKNKILFEGDARSLTSHNTVGNFDILPEHSTFISLIDKSVSYESEAGKVVKLTINNGLIKVIGNQVTVLID